MPIICFNKKHFGKIAAIAICAVLLTGICFFIGSGRNAVSAGSATNDEVGRFFTEVNDTHSIVEFFKQFNIDVKPESEIKDEIIVPEKFNITYKYYNTLQKQAGFNLERFKGVKAERSVFTMKKGGKVTILIYKGKVIAGHIESGIYGETYRPLTGECKNGKTG